MNKLLASSVNPEKLSLTIKGILGAVATIVIYFATFKGVEITQGELQSIIDNVGGIVVAIGGVVSSIAFVYGAIRKIVVQLKK